MGVGNQDQTALAFEGNWRDMIPIALTNLFLTIVTLGFYRFWATTRERQYLWSKTRFIDDTFEWTGTGRELFFGFLIVLFLFGLPFLLINLVLQGLVLQGQQGVAGLMITALNFLLLYLVGVAMFRGLRYRLSRTYWHGIHGGCDNGGWSYGWAWSWKTVAAYFTLALMIPWSMTSLWKQRWSAMSFGPHQFRSNPEWGSLMPRYLIAWFSPWLALILIVVFGFMAAIGGAAVASASGAESTPTLALGIGLLLVFAFYVLIPLAALFYYSVYMREVIGTMSLSTLDFEFTARTKDWVKLFLGNIGLYLLAAVAAAIPVLALGLLANFADLQPGQNPFAGSLLTLAAFALIFAVPFGLVATFVRFRNWSFFVRHLEAVGEINLSALTQSQTRELTQGEGLLDAFDMGAM